MQPYDRGAQSAVRFPGVSTLRRVRQAPWTTSTAEDRTPVSPSWDLARQRQIHSPLHSPGVGILTATAIIATVGDMKSFRSGREFASFLGLVPRQSGTGGKVRLLGISKRGDTYLRSLLTHGARAVVNFQIKNRNPWIDELRSRRPHNVVVVALANKIARTIWALLVQDREYDPHYQAVAD